MAAGHERLGVAQVEGKGECHFCRRLIGFDGSFRLNIASSRPVLHAFRDDGRASIVAAERRSNETIGSPARHDETI